MAGNNRIMIFGPKSDGTYVVEFRTAAGDTIASDSESRAKRFERAKKKGDRYRAESERALSARVGQILFFLHHGVPAQGATDTDLQLYDLLKTVQ